MNKVIHKISKFVIYTPSYTKYDSKYGWLVVTSNLEVLFFYAYNDSVEYTDVTDEYDIIND